ncbi:MAG: molybdate ABC transporter substrate-binding protein [Candidatus Sericytochromatia bacterium]|nr:molybdate ABC transporter substrate-binding protein [Candidatus Sericytochromatia bacterium]
MSHPPKHSKASGGGKRPGPPRRTGASGARVGGRVLLSLGAWLGLTLSLAAPASASPRLRIAAASDLREALPALLRAFDPALAPQVQVSFGASGKLATQLAQGAPFDVFLSADAQRVDQLLRSGHGQAGTRTAFATGQLVLWFPRARAPLAPLGLRALAQDPSLRLAIAHPQHAPYGRAAVEALQHAQLFGLLGPRLIRAENVAQAGQFAASGGADCALIARALVRAPGLRDGASWAVPPGWHRPVQHVAVVTAPGPAALATRWVRFLGQPAAQRILTQFGYMPAVRLP